ncbi:MAG: hypothetical protein ACRDZ4_11565 [Egibacteraceae bacterium]
MSGRAAIDVVHAPGWETQFGWAELPEALWLEQGRLARLLVGVLPYSSKAWAVFADVGGQAHLICVLDGVVRRLGGVSDCWRFDRMATVVYAGSDRVLPSFAQVAERYAVEVVVCPACRPSRNAVYFSRLAGARRAVTCADDACKLDEARKVNGIGPSREGAVEKADDLIARRWWRNAAVAAQAQAQASLDAFLASTGDARTRRIDGA